MSAESGRNSIENRSHISRPGRLPVGETAFLAEDPEMLRWRADVLMDEMMVGAIDLSASGPSLPGPSSAAPARPTAYEPLPPRSDIPSGIATPALGRNANGVYRRPVTAGSENGHHPPLQPSYHQPQLENESMPYEPAAERPTVAQWLPHAAEPPPPEPDQPVLSAADRYRRLANGQAGQPAQARPGPALSTAAAPWPEEQAWQASSNGTVRPARTYADPEADQDVNGVVRRVSAQMASVMAATATNNRRTNLLPRRSTADVEAIQREIFTLQSEIDNVLPNGHESNQRARRLLDKASTILQQDALRSAEVEYYLQQVRTIFQHVQQTIHGSSTYRNRLLVYLAGWLGLALLIIVARYLFAAPLEDFVQGVGRFTADHLVMRHFLAVTTALFAGALGGACGALFNLWQQGRQHQGFIDRKYGLRGLILPLMGALAGLLLCLILLMPLSLLNVDLARQPVLAALPALLAFLFGLTQESIYGTRG